MAPEDPGLALSWWQQIAVALGIGAGGMLGGSRLQRGAKRHDPAQRIVDAIREEGAATRKAIYADGRETRNALTELRLAVARLPQRIGGGD